MLAQDQASLEWSASNVDSAAESAETWLASKDEAEVVVHGP